MSPCRFPWTICSKIRPQKQQQKKGGTWPSQTISGNCLRRQLGQPGTTLSRCRADNSARRKVANGLREGSAVTSDKRRSALRADHFGGRRMCSRGAGVPPAGRMGSGRQAKRTMFSVISHPAARLEAAPPEVMRCLFRRFRATSGGTVSCRAGGRWAAERPHRILSLVTIHLSLRCHHAPCDCFCRLVWAVRGQ